MVKFNEILTALKKYNVQFIIIGGQAAVAQGSTHLTFDVDICYSRDKENLENVVKALTPFHPYLRGTEKDLPFIFDTKTLKMGLNFTLSTDIGDIDLFGEVKGLGSYAEVVKYSEVLEIYGIQCNVLTVEGLIKSKKVVGRPKDVTIIKELEAILEIREQIAKKTGGKNGSKS
ncbi:MAG: nucleotidyltransferase [Elusimicrobiota bacterium]